MFNLGLDELLIIGILAAFFLDAKKLAQAFKWIRVTRYRLNNLQYDIEEKVDEYLNLGGNPVKLQGDKPSPPQLAAQQNKAIQSESKTSTSKTEDNPDLGSLAIKAGNSPEVHSENNSETKADEKNHNLDLGEFTRSSSIEAKISDDSGKSLDSENDSAKFLNRDLIPQDQARDLAHFRLKRFDEEDRELHSEDLIEELDSLEVIDKSQTLAAFTPLQDEVDILPFLEDWKLKGKSLILPKVNGDDLDFYTLNSFGDLQKGAFGILEPQANAELLFSGTPDVILVPGVAFDEAGNRVGRGKGFYDRYLKKHPQAVKVGICFEKQLLNGYIAQNSWDIPMDYIVSSRRILSFVTNSKQEDTVTPQTTVDSSLETETE